MADEIVQEQDNPAPEPDKTPPAAAAPAPKPAPAPAPAAPEKPVTVAAGGKAEEPAVKPYWAEDWRDRIAGTADKRNPDRKALDQFPDPSAIFNSYKEIRSWRDKGGFVKVPGEKAEPGEVALYRKALGVPEKPEEYLDRIALPDGMVLGEADKPIVQEFAKIAHEVGAPPQFVSAAIAWQLQREEKAAAELDARDEKARAESARVLKEDWGASYDRNVNAISSLFAGAPEGLFDALMMGRTAEGTLVGDDPRIIRFLAGIAREINPAATLMEGVESTPAHLDTEIAQIEKRMREDRRGYFADENMQKRYRELIEARTKFQARSRAA